MRNKIETVLSSKKWRTFLLLLLAAVMVKMIFVASNVDEGYGIELAYRIAKGDKLITDLWEPHQTSAIFGAVLIRIFWLFTKGSNTGVTLYLHVLGAAFQLFTAYFLYRVLKLFLSARSEKVAFAAGCLYALSFPKGVIAPEYSNLQNWFMTCAALMFLLYCKKARDLYLIITGIFLSGAILAYPSMIVLYPVLVIILFYIKKKYKDPFWKALGLLTLPCILIGGGLILYVLSYCSIPELTQNISYILGDGSHTVSLGDKMAKIAKYTGVMLGYLAIYLVIAFGILKIILRRIRVQMNVRQYVIFALWGTVFISLVSQVVIWITGSGFVNTPQAEMLLLAAIGLYLGILRKNDLVIVLTVFSITGFVSTLILSNFKVTELIVYLCLAAIGGLLALINETEDILAGEDWNSIVGKRVMQNIAKQKSGRSIATENARVHKGIRLLILFWICSLSFGRIWVTSQGGELHTTLLDVRNIQKSGPGVGIFTNYMTGYRYNMVAGEWDDLIQDGESVLYVGPSSFYYMLGDVTISAPNTISTPVYDDSLLAYWELHPDRYPDVILVESSYGTLAYGDDSWIMQWITNDYQAETVQDYEYFRLYRK